MDFQPSEEQRLVADTARAFAARELAPRAAERDRHEIFPEAELRALGRLGLLGIQVPEEHGGAGAGSVAYALAMMEIAAADASVSVAFGVTNMVAEAISRFGTEAQRRAWLPGLCAGDLVCGSFALSEPQAGSDAAALRTTARRTDRGWVLDGEKLWITSGDRAGVLVVWARTDPTAGVRGISAFLVGRGTPGMSFGRSEDKLGLRGSTTVGITFDGCEVGPDALLGQAGGGFRIAMAALDGGRIGIASQAAGIAGAALAAARGYANERRSFGVPIADFQAIQWMIADSAVELDAARLLALRAAWRKDRGVPFTREASMAKLFASEKANRICDRAVQILGGYGYARDFPVERYLRDVRVTTIYEGTSEVQRMVIARSVLHP